MRNIIYSLVILVFVSAISGCEKYTDITPKGQNLMETAADLDLLMNVNYVGIPFEMSNQAYLINDRYPINNVAGIINSPSQSLEKILLTYDESADRAGITLSDRSFEGLYKIISTMNIALMQADIASGDPQLLNQIRAEALVMRAYLHYLLVNIYAKAYNPATAANDGGIPYVNDANFDEQNKKVTVKEVYDNILSDINAALDLNGLPDRPKNVMRAGKGFAYAVKAKALLSMQDYDGALEAVNNALTINNTLEDHRPLLALPAASGRTPARDARLAPENLFHASSYIDDPVAFVPTTEVLNNIYEPGNILKDSTSTYNNTLGEIFTGIPGPFWLYVGYQQNNAGMTTADLVLMKAECLIRTGQINDGMDEVNAIRIRRIAPYMPATASSEAEAMAHLQRTSRTEFLFCIWNFINIKRWNRENMYPVTIVKVLNGVTYTLQPNSPLYVFPFPQSTTLFNSSLSQNY